MGPRSSARIEQRISNPPVAGSNPAGGNRLTTYHPSSGRHPGCDPRSAGGTRARRGPEGRMSDFETQPLPERPAVVAPDGSDVRPLLRLAGGSLAHFALAPGRVSRAVAHRTVEEIW